MSRIEIRPARPAGRLLPGYAATLRKWALTADSAAGTLVLTEVRPLVLTSRSQVTALPATARTGAVTGVCLASYGWRVNLRTGTAWRLLLLDADGRAVAAGRERDESIARQMWPAEIFAPLTEAGIRVTQERYADARELSRAHPGAASPSPLMNTRTRAMIGSVLALAILVVIAIVVYAVTH